MNFYLLLMICHPVLAAVEWHVQIHCLRITQFSSLDGTTCNSWRLDFESSSWGRLDCCSSYFGQPWTWSRLFDCLGPFQRLSAEQCENGRFSGSVGSPYLLSSFLNKLSHPMERCWAKFRLWMVWKKINCSNYCERLLNCAPISICKIVTSSR